MSWSHTRTTASTYSAARVRYVLEKVSTDLVGFVARDMLSRETVSEWFDDLSFLLNAKAIEGFEFQLTRPGARLPTSALRYTLNEAGLLVEDRATGGLDFAQFPLNTRVKIVVRYRAGQPKPSVREEMRRRGWTSGNGMLTGPIRSAGAYSKGGYGLERGLVGVWDD